MQWQRSAHFHGKTCSHHDLFCPVRDIPALCFSPPVLGLLFPFGSTFYAAPVWGDSWAHLAKAFGSASQTQSNRTEPEPEGTLLSFGLVLGSILPAIFLDWSSLTLQGICLRQGTMIQRFSCHEGRTSMFGKRGLKMKKPASADKERRAMMPGMLTIFWK